MAYSDLLSTLRGQIGTAWTESKTGGIYLLPQITKIPFQNMAANNVPCAVIDLALKPSPDDAADQRHEKGTCQIYYVAPDSVSLEALIVKLEALRTQLWTTRDAGLSDGSLIWGYFKEYPQIDFQINNAMNQYLITMGKPFYCGSVIIPDLTYLSGE